MLKRYLYILCGCLYILLANGTSLYAQEAATSDNEAVTDTLPVRVKQLKQDTYEDLDLTYPFDLQNPENINSSSEGAPSKRLLRIKPDYNKALEGNLIALEIGINAILEKCPRFAEWINNIVKNCKE